MKTVSKKGVPKYMYVLIAGLASVTAWASYQLDVTHTPQVAHAIPSTQSQSPLRVQADAAVPDVAVQSIVKQFGNLQGSVDELVVLPSSTAQGYLVSATIDLGQNPQVSNISVQQAEAADVQQFFKDVYQSGQPVLDAKVYFLLSGQIVAGAGLGESAFHTLSMTASTGSGGFLQALGALPQTSTDGPGDAWFSARTISGS